MGNSRKAGSSPVPRRAAGVLPRRAVGILARLIWLLPRLLILRLLPVMGLLSLWRSVLRLSAAVLRATVLSAALCPGCPPPYWPGAGPEGCGGSAPAAE